MSCPRCGGSLATYRLERQHAEVCEECGFVGITRLRGEDTVEQESWEDAVTRVTGGETVTRTVLPTPPQPEAADDRDGGPTVTRRRD